MGNKNISPNLFSLARPPGPAAAVVAILFSFSGGGGARVRTKKLKREATFSVFYL